MGMVAFMLIGVVIDDDVEGEDDANIVDDIHGYGDVDGNGSLDADGDVVNDDVDDDI